jgi:two-component system nitrate/nitrite sensor histidine kinase NarX
MSSQKNKKNYSDEFIKELNQWVLNIMSGDLSSRIKSSDQKNLKPLCSNLNIVSEMFENQLNKNNKQLEQFAKYKEDKNKEANRLAIMEERVFIASELHDSLAQTLASLRLQVRVLDESLQGIIYMKNNRKYKTEELYTDKRITDELETLEESIELANKEIRDLIGHFRSPPQVVDNIASEISMLVENFKSENKDIKIFFQNKIPIIKSSKNDQLHIKRIAQEALINVKKHSQAKIVRVLLMSYETGKYSLIIEDDGIGIAKSCFIGHDNVDTGDHVGLGIMRDRAQQIGGHLAIESEPGEGVRVILSFNEKED